MKTRIPRDVATARRPGRPIPAAIGTAGWAQAEADRARTRTVLRAPPDWRAPAPVPRLSALKVGAVNDPLEHDANRTADQVMRMPEPEVARVQLSRTSEQEKVQKKSTALDVGDRTAPESVREALRAPGQPLDASSRGYFEPRFGHDFSRVRCILTRAPRNQHAISTPAPTPWETTLSLALAGSRRGRLRAGNCSPMSWRMLCRTQAQGQQTLFDAPRTRPLSLRRKSFRPFGTCKVALSSLSSSTDGERLFMTAVATRLDRKAMAVRRRAIGRPSMDGRRARQRKA